MDISLEAIAFFLGRAICHQLPERTLLIDDHLMPICARCTGIYIGITISLLYLFFSKRFRTNMIPTKKLSFLLFLFLFPLVIDGLGSYLGLYSTTNIIRVITGALFGVTLPFFVVPLISYAVDFNHRVLTRFTEFLIPVIATLIFLILMVASVFPLILLNIIIVVALIAWATFLCLFFFRRIHNNKISLFLSVLSSIVILVLLSFLHSSVQTFLY